MSTEPISRTLARFAHDLTFDGIPADVVDRAKYLMLDGLGIALAASRYPFARKIFSGLSDLGGQGACSIIGMDGSMSARDAVVMNGALVHGLDFDDTHMKAVVHATAAALPTALVVAEDKDVRGSQLLVAYLIGMETAIRIGMAADFGFHHRGLHATGVVGHFASAVIAGRLTGLNEDQLSSAQGIVGSTAMASQEFVEDGAWNKRLHSGWGGVAGITAAALAKSGFVAPKKPYEGRFGLFRSLLDVTKGDLDLSAITDGLGERWESTLSAVKPYPTCHFTHAVADAALVLRKRHGLDPEEIKHIYARIPIETIPVIAEPVGNKIKPASDYDAKFSAQFIVAAALVKGRFGLAELADEVLNDSKILGLAERVVCEEDPHSLFPKYYSGGVHITMNNGETFDHYEPVNRGAGDRALSENDIVEKYLANASLVVSAERTERIMRLVLGVEEIDVRELMVHLSGA
jgi:2-methylcitrate dehydratase PrpD